EPLRGYLLYAERLASEVAVPAALNFGPSRYQSVAVADLVAYAATVWEHSAGATPSWTASDEPPMHETELLDLDSARAAEVLSWENVLGWKESVTMTLDWHLTLDEGRSPREMVMAQL